MHIKAIQTRYDGCLFRSRLEARWAVFFNHLGLRWRYEPEGFEMPGFRYLPDFFLPDWDVYLEVKPDLPNEHVGAKGGKDRAQERRGGEHRGREFSSAPFPGSL